MDQLYIIILTADIIIHNYNYNYSYIDIDPQKFVYTNYSDKLLLYIIYI